MVTVQKPIAQPHAAAFTQAPAPAPAPVPTPAALGGLHQQMGNMSMHSSGGGMAGPATYGAMPHQHAQQQQMPQSQQHYQQHAAAQPQQQQPMQPQQQPMTAARLGGGLAQPAHMAVPTAPVAPAAAPVAPAAPAVAAAPVDSAPVDALRLIISSLEGESGMFNPPIRRFAALILTTDAPPPPPSLPHSLTATATPVEARQQFPVINAAFQILADKAAANQVSQEVMAKIGQVVNDINAKNFAGANAVQMDLVNTAWNSHQDWIKALKILIQCSQKKG